MGMIKVTLEDKTYQDLHGELADMQIKEMVDNVWYPKEIEEIKARIKERYEWLKENVL